MLSTSAVRDEMVNLGGVLEWHPYVSLKGPALVWDKTDFVGDSSKENPLAQEAAEEAEEEPQSWCRWSIYYRRKTITWLNSPDIVSFTLKLLNWEIKTPMVK